MSSTSQCTNARLALQRPQYPSSIRTRSQQPHLLSHVDLSTSPLKEAIRSHNHNHKPLTSHHAGLDAAFPDDNEEDEIVLSPSRMKRASSPSFATNDHAGKRVRVLGQSTFQSLSSPTRPRHIAESSLFGGSPLTPLPPTPHPNNGAFSRQPTLPQSVSEGGVNPVGSLFVPAPSTSLEPVRPGQSSPTKSRIPVPTSTAASRLPRPSPSIPLSGMATTSPTKTPHHRPMKLKPKANRQPKAEVRPRAPLTRLAAKRGRTSSLGTGLRAGTSSSTGTNAARPPFGDAGPSKPSNVLGVASGADRKRSLVTSSRASAENAAIPRITSLPHSTSTSASPTKPTPLSALSTALQKLLATPPTAPTHRSRPNTGLGLAGPSHLGPHPAASELAQSQKDDDSVVLKVFGKAQPKDDVNHRSQSPLRHSGPSGTPNGLGRMGLPVRRPGSTAGAGQSMLAAGALFASKQTTLSTVPASPAKSTAPSERDISSSSQAPQNEVLDIDALVPPVPTVDGKGKAKGDMVNLEYTVPLADESRTTGHRQIVSVSPSRRASQASLSLTQSLSLPRPPSAARLGIARSASTSTAIPGNPRTPIKTRGRTRPAPPAPETSANTKQNGPMGGKRSNARMPGSLDVLKDCVIFVDVKTEEGEDAGALFIDMLRGLGARILAKPGKSCTHLVYKDGSPVTITKYKLLPEPRPLPVSIGWVVECVENRERVDETRFLVNLDESGITGGAQRRRSMQPKQMRTLTLGLDSGQSTDISVRADSTFTSEEPSTSGPILAALSPPARSPHSLPPLERARQRSLHLSRK